MTLALPPAIAPGALIAVVAPSGPVPVDELWRGLAWLRGRYRLRIRAGLLVRDGYLAGDDGRRRDELAQAMADDDVKAIVAARGGYGVLRILDDLPWKALSRHPKWIVGFSDVTAMHAMAWRSGFASVHGPNATGLGPHAAVATRHTWLTSVEGATRPRVWSSLRVLRAGDATGPIVGGNLTLLHALAAAGRLTIPAGSILALEDVNEAPYRIDRMLTSLAMSGHLSRIAGIVLGGFDRCVSGPDGRTVDDVLEACTRGLGIPVVSGAPFGHGSPNESFVLGTPVRIHADSVRWIAQ